MAYKSFTLRSLIDNPTSKGSYLRYPSGSEAASVGLTVRDDDDVYLRADFPASVGASVPAPSSPNTPPPVVSTDPVLSDPIVAGYEIQPGKVLTKVSYFESLILDYDRLKLTWGAPLETVLSSIPKPTKILINYSPLGEPQTISEGLTLIDTASVSELLHYPTPGQWAYYTLFVKYETAPVGASAGQVYYEKAASISELMPLNYGCTDDMYAKVPEYYRMLDGQLDEGNGGPLYRMLSLFGFEADRTRTCIDYLIACKDPKVAHSQVLDVLARDLSVDMRSEELGAATLREVLNNIGTNRRSMGTSSAVQSMVQAITGSYADIDQINKVIKVYAQRANLLKDPRIYSGAKGSFSGGSPYTSEFATSLETGGASVPSVTFTYSGGDPYSSLSTLDSFPLDPNVNPSSFDDPSTFNEMWSYFPDPASGGSTTVLQTSSPSIYVIANDVLTFSMHGSIYNNAQENVLKVAIYGVGEGAASAGYTGTGSYFDSLDGEFFDYPETSLVDANGANDVTRFPSYVGGSASTPFYVDILIAEALTPTVIGGTKYWNLTIPESITNYTQVYFTVFVGNNANLLRGFSSMLLERYSSGEYFDGDSVEGGWLVESPTGSKVSDYKWYYDPAPSTPVIEGEAEFNYSVFNANYQNKRAFINRYLKELLPVNQLSKSATVYSNDTQYLQTPVWAVNWNAIPGVPYNYTLAP